MGTSPLSIDVYVAPMRPYTCPDQLGEGANVDQVDDLTVHRDLVNVQHLGHHGRLGEFAREARRPILARLVELRLPSGATCNLWSRVPASLGEMLEKTREAEPVVRVAMGDVDTRDLLAEALRPGGDLVRILEGE